MKKTFLLKLPFYVISVYLCVHIAFYIWALLFYEIGTTSFELVAKSFKKISLTDGSIGISDMWPYPRLAKITFLVFELSIFAGIYNLWKLTKNLSMSKLITSENGYLLIRLALLFILYMITVKLVRIGNLLIDQPFHIETIIGGIFGLLFNIHMVIGTLIYTIGRVLIYASAIKQENDLTV